MRVWGNYYSSDDNFPASSRGSVDTLHWPPKLRTLDYCRCTVRGNYYSSDDNCPASSRGSADTLHWPPKLRTLDSNRSIPAAEGRAGRAASASLRKLVGGYRTGRRCLCTLHNWKQTCGTIPCHPLHNPRNLLRIGNIHCPLAKGSGQALGLAPAWDAPGTNQSVQRKRS